MVFVQNKNSKFCCCCYCDGAKIQILDLNMLSQSPITELQSQFWKTKTEWISSVLKVTKSDTKRLVFFQMCRLYLYFLNFDKWMYSVSEKQ